MKTILRSLFVASLVSLAAACGSDGDSEVTVVQVENGVWADVMPGDTLRIEGDVRTERNGNTLTIIPEKGNDGVALVKVPYLIRTIRTRGNAEVVLRPMRLDTLELDAAGTSAIKIAGVATDLSIYLRGTAEVDATEMAAAHVVIDASGNASASVYVTETIAGEMSGNSKLVLYGDGTVDATGLDANEDSVVSTP